MAKPNSRATLVSYCKRALGHPVIEINVDDDQVDDRVDEGLQFYQEYHADAVEKVYLKHLVTPTDQTNGYISIPELVTNVVRVFPLRDVNNSSISMFDAKYQMHLNDMFSLGYMGSLLEYELSQQWLSMLDMIIDSNDKHIDFNRHRNQLRVDMDWSSEMIADESYLVLEAFRILDPTTYTDIYNDYYLKRYATSLIKKQWGANLSKFSGVAMLGGVTMNGTDIYSQAIEEQNKLEEQIQMAFELPVNYMIG